MIKFKSAFRQDRQNSNNDRTCMFEANLFGCHSLNTRVRLSFQLYFNHSIWTLNSWWIDGSILIYTFVINTSSTITVDLTKSNLVQVHIYKKREKKYGPAHTLVYTHELTQNHVFMLYALKVIILENVNALTFSLSPA